MGKSHSASLEYQDDFILTRFGCGPRYKVEQEILNFLKQNVLEDGTHKKYAAALAYLMIRPVKVPLIDKLCTEQARNAYNKLSESDKQAVLQELKLINQDLYYSLAPNELELRVAVPASEAEIVSAI